MRCSTVHQVVQWTFPFHPSDTSQQSLEVDAEFIHESGRRWRVPAFWAGGPLWGLRFASPLPGRVDVHIQGRHESLQVLPYEGDNPLLRHGPVTIAADRRHFQHADGTPFFWLGDTQWMSLCGRLGWPVDFQRLQLDRVEKGFTVIQLVGGLYPDMAPLDPAGANEGGLAWEAGFGGINPQWFNFADRRIEYLVSVGLAPCLVGSWGYFRKFMSLAQLRLHWRNLIARYGAYPIIWCIAGEASCPYYTDPETMDWEHYVAHWRDYAESPRQLWSDLARYIRSIEPFGRPITAHPPNYGDPELSAAEMLDDRQLLDFDMIQTHHGPGIENGGHAILASQTARSRRPAMPVVQAEGFYEGIMESCREETQRWYFWSSMLNGCAGHTYGANGVWQVNLPDHPLRTNPRPLNWGDTSWVEAAQLPGGRQVGVGKRILERFCWWQFEPHPEWIETPPPPAGPEAAARHATLRPYAAGIVGEVRLIYLINNATLAPLRRVLSLEPGIAYTARWINPSTGQATPIGPVSVDAQNSWTPPAPPTMRDWLLVLEAEQSDRG